MDFGGQITHSTTNRSTPDQRPDRVAVWCAFYSGGVIGPYFFQDDHGNAVTVNGARRRYTVTKFLWPGLRDIDTEGMRFRQDGTTCQTARATTTLLGETFNGQFRSRSGDQYRHSRSCDLTPLDFFGYEN